jgi:hypothetical protein
MCMRRTKALTTACLLHLSTYQALFAYQFPHVHSDSNLICAVGRCFREKWVRWFPHFEKSADLRAHAKAFLRVRCRLSTKQMVDQSAVSKLIKSLLSLLQIPIVVALQLCVTDLELFAMMTYLFAYAFVQFFSISSGSRQLVVSYCAKCILILADLRMRDSFYDVRAVASSHMLFICYSQHISACKTCLIKAESVF